MAEYRDIGSLHGMPGVAQEVTGRQTQVYQATHVGEKYLPYMNRSFISFSYGGKNIEDFNLIATTSGDRISRDGYSQFNSFTSEQEVLPGQAYWGSIYKTNQIVLSLATDEMTQRQLDAFVNWFAADVVRELILSEHPNRAVMARVANPPRITMLPFEKKIQIPLGNQMFDTSTTVYRGEIELTLVMDEPHWYSKVSIFGHLDNDGIYRDTWKDANGVTRSVYDDPDAVKIAYEDGIPFSTMIHESMLLGDNTYANVDYQDYSRIATMEYTPTELEAYQVWEDAYIEVAGQGGERETAKAAADSAVEAANLTETYVKGAVIAADDSPNTPQTITIAEDTEVSETAIEIDYYDEYHEEVVKVKLVYTQVLPAGTQVTPGLVAGPSMAQGTGLEDLPQNEYGLSTRPGDTAYFYYPGTAPSPTELSFTMTPQFQSSYISTPNNSFAKDNGINSYNTITFESETRQELKITTCGLYTAYNTAVHIFDNLQVDHSWVEVREDIRDKVHHKAVRAWANTVIDSFDANGETLITSTGVSDAKKRMSCMLKANANDEEGYSARFTFNSKTGKATGIIQYRSPSVGGTIPNTTSEWNNFGILTESEEDVGDMLKSNYFIIRDRNFTSDEGIISHWSEENKQNSHRFYHDIKGGISNIVLKFKNMYL